MVRTRTVALVVAFLLAALVLCDLNARASGGYGRITYHTPARTRVHTVVIRRACIRAEDSAAHLRLVKYADGRAVYGCTRRGY